MEYGSVGIQPQCQIRARTLHARFLLGETTSTVVEALFSRLSARGVPPNHVPGLIRDVCSIVGDGGLFTSGLVNERLERLGWGKETLDETTFQLIVSVLEDEWGYRVRRFALR
ncbi:MAG TPA: hypothetical protein VMU60_01140 [Syntrophobacteria bacterium]|nr:hypothetical protein [Syntrophobacteria bacterium]